MLSDMCVDNFEAGKLRKMRHDESNGVRQCSTDWHSPFVLPRRSAGHNTERQSPPDQALRSGEKKGAAGVGANCFTFRDMNFLFSAVHAKG